MYPGLRIQRTGKRLVTDNGNKCECKIMGTVIPLLHYHPKLTKIPCWDVQSKNIQQTIQIQGTKIFYSANLYKLPDDLKWVETPERFFFFFFLPFFQREATTFADSACFLNICKELAHDKTYNDICVTSKELSLYVHPMWQGFSFIPLWMAKRL